METEPAVFECPESLPLYPDLTNLQQNALVVASFAFVGIATIAFLQLYSILDTKQLYCWSLLKQSWPLLGIFVYVPVGIHSHFVEANAFECIVPPNGTWGWWYMPVSEHVLLVVTGYAEIMGGFVLAISGMLFKSFQQARFIRQVMALALFLMTVAMTFSNVYTLTHGATFMAIQDPFPVTFHVVRFTIQGLWLSCLWYMATHESLGGGDAAQVKTD